MRRAIGNKIYPLRVFFRIHLCLMHNNHWHTIRMDPDVQSHKHGVKKQRIDLRARRFTLLHSKVWVY
jgi:hypothetical protein